MPAMVTRRRGPWIVGGAVLALALIVLGYEIGGSSAIASRVRRRFSDRRIDIVTFNDFSILILLLPGSRTSIR
jgi:hypothetical protein